MDDLTAESLRQTLGDNLREGLKDISDPVDDYGRQLVYDDAPHVKGAEFDGYPYILLADYGATVDTKTADSRSVFHDGSAEIHVYGKRDSPDQKSNFDQLSDAVDNNMLTGFNGELQQVRIARVQTESDNRFPDRDEKDEPIIVRELTYSFKTQLRY